MLLEKKLSALADSLEKKEAQLNEVLSASNLDPTALTVVTRKLEDVLDSKNSAIKVGYSIPIIYANKVKKQFTTLYNTQRLKTLFSSNTSIDVV